MTERSRTGAKMSKRAACVWQRISAVRATDLKLWCARRFPVLEWAPHYSLKENLLPDTVSGLHLAVYQVTQGLIFACMSSVHPVFGLYGSIIPSVVYAVFGTGRHVVTGTFAITSLISAGAVERLVPPINISSAANYSPDFLGLSDFEFQRIGVAAAVSFLGGVIQVAMFILQLDRLTFLMTESVISSMTTGAATHAVNAVVKHLLGLKMPYISGPLGMFYIYAYVFNNIRSVKLEAALLSVFGIILLLVLKEVNEHFKKIIKILLPVELVWMVAVSVACYLANMENSNSLDVLGHIPRGIPAPQAPPMNILSEVIIEGFGLAFAGYAASIVLAHRSAKNMKCSADDNQELLAHGLSNVIPSFFYCIPNAAAMGRTSLLLSNGAKTQVASLVSCSVILLLIYVADTLLYWLPMCVLASIVVVSLKGMLMQFCDLKKYWNTDKYDCVIWICTYVVTICFAAHIGLLFGVIFNIVVAVARLTRAKILHLETFDQNNCDVIENMTCVQCQKVKIVSVGMPLFFLNAKKFHADLLKIHLKNSEELQLQEEPSKVLTRSESRLR
ncbi:anion exchange transporter [Pleurodeles waltl]|uniref:anion exchange transporter n=1 Tax=Pleurodeles waltl TaxID=8319 RepID=UPI0037094224